MQVALTADQVSILQSQMPAAAQAYGSGIFYDGATLTVPDAFAAAAQAVMAVSGWDSPAVSLKAYAAAARYAKETGGITVGNAPIATDRGSQTMIANTLADMTQRSVATVNFKTGAGFVSLSLAQITAISKAVGAHVQACFDAEQAVDAGISATPPTITTTAQIDAGFRGRRRSDHIRLRRRAAPPPDKP